MAQRSLRAVTPEEKAPVKRRKPPVPRTISGAVEKGSARDVLAAMRRALAQKLDAGEVSSNAIASAYKELRELDRLIRLADAEQAEGEASSAGKQRRRSFDATAI